MIKTLPTADFKSSLVLYLSSWSTKKQGQFTSPVTKLRLHFGAKLIFWQQNPEEDASSVPRRFATCFSQTCLPIIRL